MEIDMDITNNVLKDDSFGHFNVSHNIARDFSQKLLLAEEEDDLWRQKHYDTKRSLNYNEASLKEIDFLLNQFTEDSDFEDNLLKETNEKIQSLRKLNRELDDQYFQEEDLNFKEIETLENEIASISKRKQSPVKIKSDCEILPLAELQSQRDKYSEELLFSQQELEDLLKSMNLANNEVEKLVAAISETEERTLAMNTEIRNINEEGQELSDELVLLESQLNMKKFKPQSSSSRGNSLFAEIDTKDKVLKGKMESLKKSYNSKKQAVARSYFELKKLRLDYISLLDVAKKAKSDSVYNPAKEEIIEKLVSVCKELEESYVDFPCKFIVQEGEEANMETIEFMLNQARDKLKGSREMMYRASADCLKIAQELCNTRLESMDTQHAILLEEAKTNNLTAILKDINGPDSKFGDDETIQESKYEDSTCDNTIVSSSLPSNEITITGNNKKPPLKFINIQKIISLDDIC